MALEQRLKGRVPHGDVDVATSVDGGEDPLVLLAGSGHLDLEETDALRQLRLSPRVVEERWRLEQTSTRREQESGWRARSLSLPESDGRLAKVVGRSVKDE